MDEVLLDDGPERLSEVASRLRSGQVERAKVTWLFQ